MKHFRAYLGKLSWAASGTPYIDIERGNFLRRLILFVDGGFTLAAGSASGTARSEAPSGIFSRIRLVGDGIGNIKDFDGTGLHLSTRMHNMINAPVVTSDGSAAAHVLRSIYTLDFAQNYKRNMRPADTFLDTRRFSTLKLETDFSANLRDAVLSGCDRTESLSTATIHVYGDYERPHANFGEPLLYVQNKMAIPVVATASDLRFPLNVDQTYKNLILSAQVKASGGQFTGNNSLLVDYNLEFNANRTPLKKINFLMQQYLDTLDLGTTAVQAGGNFLQFDNDSSLKESLVTLNGSSLAFILNVALQSGTNEIWAYPGILKAWPYDMRNTACIPAASAAVPLVPTNRNAS